MSDPLKARWCPVCGADTNRTGHKPGCLRAKNDPEWRDPHASGGSLWLVGVLLLVGVVIAYTGSWWVLRAVWDAVHGALAAVFPALR